MRLQILRMTEAKEVSIKAIAENGLIIIKEVSHFVIKIFQSIIVNDEEIDRFEEEYILESDSPIEKSQVYSEEFDWGILSIINNVLVTSSVDHDIQSALSSIIEFNYFIEHSKHHNDNEQPEDNEPEIPSEDNPGENEPVKPDEVNPDEDEPIKPGEDNLDEDEPVKPDNDNPDEDEPIKPGEDNLDEDEPVKPDNDNPDEDEPVKPDKTIQTKMNR